MVRWVVAAVVALRRGEESGDKEVESDEVESDEDESDDDEDDETSTHPDAPRVLASPSNVITGRKSNAPAEGTKA